MNLLDYLIMLLYFAVVVTDCAWGVLDGSNGACFGTKGVS